jgi:hypothetical protein
VRSSSVVKDYQAYHLQLFIKIEQNGLEMLDRIRKFMILIAFGNQKFLRSVLFTFFCWACVVVLYLRADMMFAYEHGKFKSLS